MANTLERAEFWKEFICTNSQFPAPERLRAQFAAATVFDLCNCGCSSFAVRFEPDAPPGAIAEKGIPGLVFEAHFSLAEGGKTLEILLFADAVGNLSYVEIDCCGNSYPVPDVIQVLGPPHHVRAVGLIAP